jgi:hypothetical protein
LNIKLSPPKDPVAFSSLLSSDSIVDIDADYFGDLQNECYIPRTGPSDDNTFDRHDIQTVARVELPIAATSGFHASLSNRSKALLWEFDQCCL